MNCCQQVRRPVYYSQMFSVTSLHWLQVCCNLFHQPGGVKPRDVSNKATNHLYRSILQLWAHVCPWDWFLWSYCIFLYLLKYIKKNIWHNFDNIYFIYSFNYYKKWFILFIDWLIHLDLKWFYTFLAFLHPFFANNFFVLNPDFPKNIWYNMIMIWLLF